MSKFIKKAVIVEATQWFKNGDHPQDYPNEKIGIENGQLRIFSSEECRKNEWEGQVVRYFRHPNVPGNKECEHCGMYMSAHGWIDTLEGGHIVCPGDWVITGVKGERYPCKPDIFAQTYDSAAHIPAGGWTCFHCGERFTNFGGAQDHFGESPHDRAACLIKVGEERGLVMSLRRAHKDREELWQIIDDIDTVSDAAKGDDAGYRRAVERMVKKRFVIAESPDGQTLSWKRDCLWSDSAKEISRPVHHGANAPARG